MKTIFKIIIFLFIGTTVNAQEGFIVNHTSTDLSQIPDAWITAAKQNLKIRYFRRSHGSQVDKGGMDALKSFSAAYASKYSYGTSGNTGELFFSVPLNSTVWVSLDYENTTWVQITRDYLDDPLNSTINVVMWAWSSNFYACSPQQYLDDMEMLIGEYGPNGTKIQSGQRTVPVTFIFQTACGQRAIDRNELVFNGNKLIRQHCIAHNRILFDFNDIECYNPDGTYFGDGDANSNYTDVRRLNDDLAYISASPGGSVYPDSRNWGLDWMQAHPTSELTQLASTYCTSCAHSEGTAEGETKDNSRLHCVLKGRAAWWLFARLAGWQQKSFTISTSTALNERNLGSALINISLSGDTFLDGILSSTNFQISGAPNGTTIKSVTYNNTQSATLALSYNGTDFDTDYSQFKVTIAGAELTGNSQIASNTLNIDGLVESMTITANAALNEVNLSDGTLTVQLTDDNFIDNSISLNNIQLVNAPAGVSVAAVTYLTNQSISVALDFNGTDFDVNYPQFKITLLAVELAGGDNLSSNSLTITAYNESMSITPNAALNEYNIADGVITVQLSNDNFKDNQISLNNIQLVNAPVGLSAASVTYLTNQSIRIALDYNGSDFDINYPQFKITILAAELVGGDNLTSNTLTITAYNESMLITPNAVLNENNIADAVLVVQLSGDRFIDSQISLSNILLKNAPPGLTVSGVTYIGNQQIQIALDFNGTNFDVDFTHFSITIKEIELYGHTDLNSNEITIHCIDENNPIAHLDTIESLLESKLDGAKIKVVLKNETFVPSGILFANFIPKNAPLGLSFSGVQYLADTVVEITLAFNGSDFDADSSNFSISINGNALFGNKDISTDSTTIIAENENSISDPDNELTIKLFPNPGNGNITLEFEEPKFNELMVQLFDLNGKLVFTKKYNSISGNSINLNFSNFKKGHYLLKLKDSKKQFVKSLIFE